MERTLSIVKPDAVAAGHTWAILGRIEAAGLRVAAIKKLWLREREAQEFYAVHRERPFYSSLVKFMTSGPIVASVLVGEDAIAAYRRLMGATNPEQAEPGEIAFFFSEIEILSEG
jgi:nucleoside-diphosphate kinase